MGGSSIFTTITSLVGAQQAALSYGLPVVLALAVYGYFYYRNLYAFFERRGLKNPPIVPLVGNLHTIVRANRMELVREWTQKYGKLYGVFHGIKPKLVVADPDVLRQVCIKDFDAMPNHERSHLLNHYQKNFLFFMQDEQWKRVRAMQTPIFTSGKIKRMFKLLDKCADDLVECFQEQLGASEQDGAPTIVDLKEIFSLYTLDCIASAAYSLKLDRQGTSSIKAAASRDQFARQATEILNFNPVRLTFVMSVPNRLAKWLRLTTVPASKVDRVAGKVRRLIESRKNSAKKFDDYLQILVDARLDDKVELGCLDDKENHHAGLTRDSLQADQAKMLSDIKQANGGPKSNGLAHHANGNGPANGNQTAQSNLELNDEEVVASAIFLLIVGVETTASLLTACTYALAFHQDVQERLYQTVKSMAEWDEARNEFTFDYDSLTSSVYLDAVISETLRALSPVIELDRYVSRDCYIEKYGLTLKKGDVLLLAYYAIMNDPDYFPEPEKFNPERFMPENRDKIYPGSYCPFGLGPRHCLGMRFSLTEAKFALAKVLLKYKFLPAPNTSYPPKTKHTFGLNLLDKPFARLQLR